VLLLDVNIHKVTLRKSILSVVGSDKVSVFLKGRTKTEVTNLKNYY